MVSGLGDIHIQISSLSFPSCVLLLPLPLIPLFILFYLKRSNPGDYLHFLLLASSMREKEKWISQEQEPDQLSCFLFEAPGEHLAAQGHSYLTGVCIISSACRIYSMALSRIWAQVVFSPWRDRTKSCKWWQLSLMWSLMTSPLVSIALHLHVIAHFL